MRLSGRSSSLLCGPWDVAPVYRTITPPLTCAVVVRDFLQRQQVVRMDWPARSPDLAPIENLWDILGRRVVDNHPHPTDAAQLFQFLQQEWHAIPQQMLQNLVHSMRQRVVDCLAANGGHTSY
nr:hypothetical protein BaRGS_011813 [Batillaria attramentaria]